MKAALSLLAVLTLPAPSPAQGYVRYTYDNAGNRITIELNAMRDSDMVVMQPVAYCWAGDGGADTFWDFSWAEEDVGYYPIEFHRDTLGHYVRMENGHISSFLISEGLLQQFMDESRMQHITYSLPKLSMRYPLEYGDSICMPFAGHGSYCGDHQLLVRGQVNIMADGYGTLVLTDRDTLSNALRVYTLTSTSMAMDMDSIALDTAMLKQEIEERYDWYARGFRYPLYTSILRTSYSNLNVIASRRLAYRILPADCLLAGGDEKNDSILKADSLQRIQTGDMAEDTFHYEAQAHGGKIYVSYIADEGACISTIVSDVMGFVYRRERTTVMGGASGNFEINCSGMKPGSYILYMNVNGKVYSSKVNL